MKGHPCEWEACLKDSVHDALGGDIKGGARSLGRIDPVNNLLPVPVL